MEAVVSGQFWVKRCSQQLALLCSHDAAIRQGAKRLRLAMHRFDDWGADEDGMVRRGRFGSLLERFDIQVSLEGVYLAAKSVARHSDIHQVKQGLGTTGILREEDRPGAGAPDGVLFTKLDQWLHQAEIHGQLADGGRFAAGDDQPIQPCEMAGQAHLGALNAQALEHCNVFCEIALDGKDSDFHRCFMGIRRVRQPRIAR